MSISRARRMLSEGAVRAMKAFSQPGTKLAEQLEGLVVPRRRSSSARAMASRSVAMPFIFMLSLMNMK